MELPPRNKTTPFVEIAWVGPVVQIRFVGPDIGQREVPNIREDIAPYLELKSIESIEMDLSAVTFMSSAGLSMFISLLNAAAANKTRAVRILGSDRLKTLLGIAKLTDRI